MSSCNTRNKTQTAVTPTSALTDECYNNVVQPLLTDLYQITMAYAYWKAGKANDKAVFEAFFRKNPFHGEFAIFAGLEECLKFLKHFKFSTKDIEYLRQTLSPQIEPEFYQYLAGLTANDVTLRAMEEGTVVFPKIPLLIVEGPLIVCQLLETTLLNLVNYPSLVATNAARYRMAAGDISLLEFGLRRAQGPDGGLSASKYCYMGGFDGTSNVLAGKLFGIPVKGTHAHSFITSYASRSELGSVTLKHKNGTCNGDLLKLSLAWRDRLVGLSKMGTADEANEGEFTAMISYAIAFPDGFLALVDTYDVKKSGLLNFCSVALGLNELGYRALGIRIDSGDLAYLSKLAQNCFTLISTKFNVAWFKDLSITASNDINEETILSLNEQGHKISCFGIGTHIVTCQKQPALGGVYKMVELNGLPRIKLSEMVEKITIPGCKNAYRLYGESGEALIDLLQRSHESEPRAHERILCRHPFQAAKRAYVTAARVEVLHKIYWSGGQILQRLPNLQQIRERVRSTLNSIRGDIKRYLNPTPYKVSVSDALYTHLHDMWDKNAPVGELS